MITLKQILKSLINHEERLDSLEGYEIEIGTFSVTNTTTGLENKTINFQKTFSKVPYVFLTICAAAGYVTKYGYDNATVSSFNVRTSQTTNQTAYYVYMAIAKK